MVNDMNVDIHSSWATHLQEYFELPEWKKLAEFVRQEYQHHTIYPHPKNIFNALNMTPFNDVKVVIIGQDPYHNPGQAHGLSFSVPDEITPPPSLKNIYKEIESDLGIIKDFSNGNLISWAKQGVLLLNSVLTVRENEPGSHANRGWEYFTDHVIKKISDEQNHVVFLLWGNYAKKKGLIINRDNHCVLETSHPSPLSARHGFIGCKHFSATNNYLRDHHQKEISW